MFQCLRHFYRKLFHVQQSNRPASHIYVFVGAGGRNLSSCAVFWHRLVNLYRSATQCFWELYWPYHVAVCTIIYLLTEKRKSVLGALYWPTPQRNTSPEFAQLSLLKKGFVGSVCVKPFIQFLSNQLKGRADSIYGICRECRDKLNI